MQSKTPKFDALLDKILDGLVPHAKTCTDCGKEFKIESDDITFYKMLRVPPPKLCPDCRQRRRLSFANYTSIYRRKCDVLGHSEMMISPVAPVMPWITYDHETYYSDKWDPKSYERDVGTKGDFFPQFLELLKVVPQPGVRRGDNMVNCDFSFYGRFMKDCYYVFGGRKCEDMMFCSSIYRSKHSVDSYSIYDNDTVYQNISTSNCFKVNYGYFSQNCIDCDFVFDCRNCQNCFGCVNLRNKNYCWFNEQLTRDEYFKRKAVADLRSIKNTKTYKDKFWQLVKSNPVRSSHIFQSNNCTGEDIRECNNCRECFQIESSENLKYASFAIVKLKDSMDVGHLGGSERIYYSQNSGSANVKFSFANKGCFDCDYIMSCHACTNCFGCVGLKNVSFAIFNKIYEEEEYWKILDELKSQMLSDETYGEFFPMNFSPCAYNSSLAQIMYPMTEEEATKRGLYWQPDTDVDTKGLKSLNASELPDHLNDVTEELYNTAIIGEISGKPYKIIPREVEFYKRSGLSLPTDTPHQRTLDRFKILSNFKMNEETCNTCRKKIKSLFKKSDGFKPICEECYLKEVI